MAELHDLLLPAVLLLKDGDAWIVRRAGPGERPRYDIVMPGRRDLLQATRAHRRRDRGGCTTAWCWWPRPGAVAAPALPVPTPPLRCATPAALAVGHDASLHAVLPLGAAGGAAATS
jgi:hypothetical protein